MIQRVDPLRESPASRSIARSLRVVVGALVLCGIYFGKALLLPLVLAVLFGFVLLPLVNRMRVWGLRQGFSVTLVVLVTIGALGGTGLFLTTQVRSLAVDLPGYQSTVRSKMRDLREQLQPSRALSGLGSVLEDLQGTEDARGRGSGTGAARDAQPVVVVRSEVAPLQQASELAGRVLPGLAMTATFLLYLVLILLDPADLRDRALRLLGGSLYSAGDAIDEAGRRVSRYLLMQLVVNVTYAVPLAVGLALIGVPGAALWGAVSAVLRFVPYVGALIGAAFPLLLAFAVDPGWTMFAWALALILLLELVSNNVVEPWLYGASTGLSMMSVIVAATFWTALWGPAGLVISTPITVTLLVLGRHVEGLRFLEVLLGRRSALDPPQRFHQRLLSTDISGAHEIALTYAATNSPREFYDTIALPVLRMTMEERLGSGYAERRHRVLSGLDNTIDMLAESFPAGIVGVRPECLIVTGGGWVDRLAAKMAVHALESEGIGARTVAAPQVTSSFIAQLALQGDETLCTVYLGNDALPGMQHLCRRLRRRWPDLEILVARWAGPAAGITDPQLEKLGADAAVHDITNLVTRLAARHGSELSGAQPADDTDPQEEQARLASLQALQLAERKGVLDVDQRAREIADIFDVPVARIAWLDAEHVLTAGDSRRAGRLLGGKEEAAPQLRAESLHDRVVKQNDVLLVQDTERDPRHRTPRGDHAKEPRFFAGVPLRDAQGRALGVLSLEDAEPRSFVKRDLKLLEALALKLTRDMLA